MASDASPDSRGLRRREDRTQQGVIEERLKSLDERVRGIRLRDRVRRKQIQEPVDAALITLQHGDAMFRRPIGLGRRERVRFFGVVGCCTGRLFGSRSSVNGCAMRGHCRAPPHRRPRSMQVESAHAPKPAHRRHPCATRAPSMSGGSHPSGFSRLPSLSRMGPPSFFRLAAWTRCRMGSPSMPKAIRAPSTT